MRFPRLGLPVLIVLWVLILLFANAVSPSYLVEGARNTLGFSFPSKEVYVFVVRFVHGLYYITFALLILLTWEQIKTLFKR